MNHLEADIVGRMAADHIAHVAGELHEPTPHEYVGTDVDIGVGVQWEPCQVCGDGGPDAPHHVAPKIVYPDEAIEEIPF